MYLLLSSRLLSSLPLTRTLLNVRLWFSSTSSSLLKQLSRSTITHVVSRPKLDQSPTVSRKRTRKRTQGPIQSVVKSTITEPKFSNAMHSTPYYTSNPLQTKSNSHEHPRRCVHSFYAYPSSPSLKNSKEKSRLLLILGLILVNLEVSEGVGVFGGSDDSVRSASERGEEAVSALDRRESGVDKSPFLKSYCPTQGFRQKAREGERQMEMR